MKASSKAVRRRNHEDVPAGLAVRRFVDDEKRVLEQIGASGGVLVPGDGLRVWIQYADAGTVYDCTAQWHRL
jgi:hypothetical protein